MLRGSIDAIAKVRFYLGRPPTQIDGKWIYDDGLHQPFTNRWFGCPVQIDDAFHDARFLNDSMPIEPGQTYTLPVGFLRPDIVLPKLSIGLRIFLMKNAVLKFGEAKILEIVDRSASAH